MSTISALYHQSAQNVIHLNTCLCLDDDILRLLMMPIKLGKRPLTVECYSNFKKSAFATFGNYINSLPDNIIVKLNIRILELLVIGVLE